MGNFELLDNLFQIAVLLCACCAAGFFALRHKSRSLLILSLAYACFAMGTTYYVLYLVIMGIWPQVFYVAEISWLAAWLFYLSAQIERTEGRRVGFSCPAALAAAVLAATAFLDRDFGPSRLLSALFALAAGATVYLSVFHMQTGAAVSGLEFHAGLHPVQPVLRGRPDADAVHGGAAAADAAGGGGQMTYIENIYLCLALPLILSLFFVRGRSRRYALFLVIGMTVCLLSAYVSSFFMGYYGADGTTAAIEITPVCEEGMKLLPLLFFYLIFEPAPQELPAAAIALAAGFATFENVCYLTENGAADFRFLLIRGIAAGALHILCGVLSGFGVSQVFCRRWLAVTGTAGILGACTGFHAIYNLLITAEGGWRMAGYLFPSALLAVLAILSKKLDFLPRRR